MKRTFKINNVEYTVITCTAIAASIDETERVNALYVYCYEESGEKVDHVVFNWNMPEDESEFLDMCEDYSAWDGWDGTLETVEFTD